MCCALDRGGFDGWARSVKGDFVCSYMYPISHIHYPIIYDINNGLFIFSVAMATCCLAVSYAEITSLQLAGRFRVFADTVPICLIDQLCRCNP